MQEEPEGVKFPLSFHFILLEFDFYLFPQQNLLFQLLLPHLWFNYQHLVHMPGSPWARH